MNGASPRSYAQVQLGREQTHALLPHRPPLLLVDEIIALGSGKEPALRASYRILPDAQVFAGHFPGRPLWPGSYTIEGLAQSCALLAGLAGAAAIGRAPLPLPASWALSPPASPGQPVLAAVKIKLTRPVVPPADIVYEVALTHVVGAICRFDAEAACNRVVVAQGTLSVACVAQGDA